MRYNNGAIALLAAMGSRVFFRGTSQIPCSFGAIVYCKNDTFDIALDAGVCFSQVHPSRIGGPEDDFMLLQDSVGEEQLNNYRELFDQYTEFPVPNYEEMADILRGRELLDTLVPPSVAKAFIVAEHLVRSEGHIETGHFGKIDTTLLLSWSRSPARSTRECIKSLRQYESLKHLAGVAKTITHRSTTGVIHCRPPGSPPEDGGWIVRKIPRSSECGCTPYNRLLVALANSRDLENLETSKKVYSATFVYVLKGDEYFVFCRQILHHAIWRHLTNNAKKLGGEVKQKKEYHAKYGGWLFHGEEPFRKFTEYLQLELESEVERGSSDGIVDT